MPSDLIMLDEELDANNKVALILPKNTVQHDNVILIDKQYAIRLAVDLLIQFDMLIQEIDNG